MHLAFVIRFIDPSLRHNGVVVEPTDGVDRRRSIGDEGPHSSGSRSKSRSRTPSSKETPTAPTSLPPSTVPPGPQSYYRQHTFTGGECARVLARLPDASLYSYGPSTRDDDRWPLSPCRWSSYIRNSVTPSQLATSTSLGRRWFTTTPTSYDPSRLHSSLLQPTTTVLSS